MATNKRSSSLFYVELNDGNKSSENNKSSPKPVAGIGRAKNFLVKKLTAHRKSLVIESTTSEQTVFGELTAEMTDFVSDFTQFLNSTESFLKSLKTEPISTELKNICFQLRGQITSLREYDVSKLLSKVPPSDQAAVPPVDNDAQHNKKVVHVSPMQTVPPQLPKRPSQKSSMGSGSLDDYNSSGSSGRNTLETGRNTGGDSGRNTAERSTGGRSTLDEDEDNFYDETDIIPITPATQPAAAYDDEDIYDEFDDIQPELDHIASSSKDVVPEPVKIEPELVTPNSIGEGTKAGFLTEKKEKKGLLRGNPKRWCILDKDIFYTFTDLKAREPKFSQSVKGFEIVALPSEKNKKQTGFEIHQTDGALLFTFFTPCKEELISWMEVLQKAAGTTPKCGTRQSILQVVDDDGGDVYDDIDTLPPPSFKPPTRPPPVTNEVIDDIYDDAESESTAGLSTAVTSPPVEVSDIYDDGESLQQPPLASKPLTQSNMAAITTNIKGVTTTASVVDNEGDLYDDGTSIIPDQNSNNPVFNFLHATPVQLAKPVQLTGKQIEEFYLAKWDSQDTRDDELHFQKGERIKVTDKLNDAELWWTAEINGKIGLVPKTFLKPAYAKVHN